MGASALCQLGAWKGTFDADRNAALPPPDTPFEQRHCAAAHQHRRTESGVEHDPIARLQSHHIGQPHRLLIQYYVKFDFGVPQFLGQVRLPDRVAADFSPMNCCSSNSRTGSRVA